MTILDYVFRPTTDPYPRPARGQSCQCPEVTNRPGQEPHHPVGAALDAAAVRRG
jgi:hypothetical protein